jgi:hypothetical protein
MTVIFKVDSSDESEKKIVIEFVIFEVEKLLEKLQHRSHTKVCRLSHRLW